MKRYYVKHPRNFGNEYSLCWIDAADKKGCQQLEERGYERITRKAAYAYVSQEKWARQHDQAFSGYGDIRILPHWVEAEGYQVNNTCGDDSLVVEREWDENHGFSTKTLYTDDGVLFYR